jgi:hypothetical protein
VMFAAVPADNGFPLAVDTEAAGNVYVAGATQWPGPCRASPGRWSPG